MDTSLDFDEILEYFEQHLYILGNLLKWEDQTKYKFENNYCDIKDLIPLKIIDV